MTPSILTGASGLPYIGTSRRAGTLSEPRTLSSHLRRRLAFGV